MQLQSTPTMPDDLSLQPPWGYRPMAWFGLVANLLLIPLSFQLILVDPHWRTVNIAVGAGGVLPTVVLGVIASIALLRWQHWGLILAIVALSLSLGVSLPYVIVRLVMVEPGRGVLAAGASLVWSLNVATLLFWCRPAIRAYLR